MMLFRIKTLEEVKKNLNEDTCLSETGEKFFRDNGNKVITGELERKRDNNTREFFLGIIFNKIDKNELKLYNINRIEMKWMEENFIITELDYISNIDNNGNYMLELYYV